MSPVANGGCAVKPGFWPLRSRTTTWSLSFRVAARSSRPSLLKSPAAIVPMRAPSEIGEPASCAKPPPGWRSSTDTLPPTKLDTARSASPSPL
jgi:hypothetical protein